MKHPENASGPEFHEDCWRVVQLWHGSTCGQGSEMFESHEVIGIESFVGQPKQPTKRNLPSSCYMISLILFWYIPILHAFRNQLKLLKKLEAWAMARCAELQPGERVLDPMCGKAISMGVSLNGGTPISHPKCWSFLAGKPMVVGETHHFRKPPYNCLWKRYCTQNVGFLRL